MNGSFYRGDTEFVFTNDEGKPMETEQKIPQHTPGPWYMVPIHQNWVEICDGPGNTERCIIASVLSMADDYPAELPIAHRNANARLIAAVPELLRSLNAMVQAFVRHPGNHDERHHALTIARAAIAKATKP
jgi:hypothetical protein